MDVNEARARLERILRCDGKPAQVMIQKPRAEGVQWEAASGVGQGIFSAQQSRMGASALDALHNLTRAILQEDHTPLTPVQVERLQALEHELAGEA